MNIYYALTLASRGLPSSCQMPSSVRSAQRAALAFLIVACAACGGGESASGGTAGPATKGPAAAAGKGPGGPGGMPPAAVGVIEVRSGPVPLVTELSGRVEALRVAQVRARAAGIVQKRLFEEGTDVRAGQVLYRIDPAPLQASLANVEANLRRAEAALASARQKEERYKPLVATRAVSEQEYADYVATRQLAEADVNAARAARQTARLNLSYAEVTAPIAGRVGRSLVTEGALVGQGEATPLTTIQQLDPVYVNIVQPSAEWLRLRKQMAAGNLKAAQETPVKVLLEDGSTYPQSGRLLFTDVTIDQGTSSVTMRATVPNPQRLLLPGLYVRAQLAQAVDAQAWRIPQQALVRRGDTASVMVVGPDNKVVVKPVKVSGSVGTDWVVTEGLADGDRVIVDGLQKAMPGMAVQPVPWAPGGAAPQAAGAGGTAAPSAAGGTPAAGSPGAPGSGAAASGVAAGASAAGGQASAGSSSGR